MMMTTDVTPVSTDRFVYDPERRVFSAFASDLPAFARVFDDACDVGLSLVSARTGRAVPVTVDGTERDAEGDLLSWTLRPVAAADRGLFAVVVFND